MPTRAIEYRGVTLREMDVDAVIARRPTVALVDELAHTNVPGSKFRKRWEDVLALIDAGINVICAVNVQHLESLNDVIQQTLGVTVRETVPDWVISQADQVVNIDLSAEDLRERLADGKIYGREKIPAALENFFTAENLTTLRELALREVASSVDRVREAIVRRETGQAPAPRSADRIMVAMSSDPPRTASLLRRASRIAGRLNTDWYCVYVQTPDERADRIDATVQRRLVDNIQKAQSMGAMVMKLEDADVAGALRRFAREHGVALVILGRQPPDVVAPAAPAFGGGCDDRRTRRSRRAGGGQRPRRSRAGDAVRVGQRLMLAVLPAVIGVFSVAALAYWGQYAHQAPEMVIVVAAVAAVISLVLAWRNTRYVAHRVAQLATRAREEPDRPARRIGGRTR